MSRVPFRRLALLAAVACVAVWGGGALAGTSQESVFDQLDELELKAQETTNRISVLQAREKALSKRLGETGAAYTETETRLKDQRQRLALRLRNFYKLQSVGRSEYLFGAHDLLDLDRRRAYLERLMILESRQRSDYEKTLSATRQAKAGVETERDELHKLIAQLNEEKRELDRKLLEKREFVATLKRGGRNSARAARELAEAREKLTQKVARLGPADLRENDPVSGKRFAAQKGRLLCPVKAKITRGFGEIQKDGAKSFHGGIDLAADYGQTLRAPAPGTVVYAGTFRGFGNLLIIDHGGGYHTLYGHLSQIDVTAGTKIEAGTTLAKTGDSGSLEGPFLYFELRFSGKPQNPADWFTCR